MSKRPTAASFPPPSAEVESTPSTIPAHVPRTSPAVPQPDSNPYYIPPDSDDSDSDDESSSDESVDHGGEIGPPAYPAVDAVAPHHEKGYWLFMVIYLFLCLNSI